MKSGRTWTGAVAALAAAAAATIVAMAMRFEIVNVAMLYMVAVAWVAMRYPRAWAILAALLCVAALDFFFVSPRYGFTVDDTQYLVTFGFMVAVALVISQLARSGDERARAHAALELAAESERIRSTLLASISHDLRTPLAVMTGASSTLVERGEALPAPERQALARSVLEQSLEISARVSKVLQMTRLETGAVPLERDWASIAEIAGSVLRRLHDVLQAHRLVVELPADLPLVRVDAALIEQCLENLLENAARHTPGGTVVRLSARVAGSELVVSVEDHGGTSPAHLERLFKKFERGSSTRAAPGVGLGLAICRAIVALHGGRIVAEALAGGGTAFRFTLPLEPVPQAPAEAALP